MVCRIIQLTKLTIPHPPSITTYTINNTKTHICSQKINRNTTKNNKATTQQTKQNTHIPEKAYKTHNKNNNKAPTQYTKQKHVYTPKINKPKHTTKQQNIK